MSYVMFTTPRVDGSGEKASCIERDAILLLHQI